MAEVPFRPARQLSEYKGKGASANKEFTGTSASWSGQRALLSAILFLILDVKICQILEDLSFTLHAFCKSIRQKKRYRKH